MKSNQERSNGCLPPKKREILALEQRPVVAAAVAPVAVAPDVLHTENLAWLASVASERCRSTETSSPRFPVVSSSSISSISSSTISSPSSSVTTALTTVPLTSLPTIYGQQGGAIQYAQLAPNVQFISSAALAGPYAGYISSQILPTATPNPAGPRPQLDAYTATVVAKGDQQQQHFQIGLSPDSLAVSLPSSAHITGHQYIHLEGAPLTVSAPSSAGGHHHQLPLQLHPHPHHPHHPHPTATVLPHHTLTLGPSQLLVQYSDAKRGGHEGVGKGLANGESELGKSAAAKAGSGHAHQHHHQQVQGYEARHILLPADYCHDGLQTTSLVLVAGPQPPGELDAGANKGGGGGGGVRLGGRPVSRGSAFSSSSSSSSSSIQTTSHAAADELLYSSAQTTPIIGYIAGPAHHHHHQHAVSYHATLPQHLVIPGGQSLLIPVSGGGGAGRPPDPEPPRSVGVATTQLTTAMPHAYLATALAKCELLGSSPSSDAVHRSSPAATAVVQAIVPGNASPAPPVPVPASPPPPLCSSSVASSSPASLPPFFTRGSIIQLADGELKRVEDLRTEDFIRSAEISSELKIDSSTVERIDRGPAPDAVLIQFAVGELKAQVCVEVLVEYPFFVFGQGWSSCSPDRTTRLFELSCAKLCVGDVCVSLTLRGLRNGSVRVGGAGGGGGQGLEVKLRGVAGGDGPPGQSADAVQAAGSNGRPSARKTAPAGGAEDARGPTECETPDPGRSDPRRTQSADADRPPVRKRRWSAPERDQTDKAAAEEEPPATLPKPSFLPHEVKVSIEGRSSMGS